MRDLVFVALTVGFFALAALSSACDRIVGPDPCPTWRRRRARRGWPMTADNVIGLVIAFLAAATSSPPSSSPRGSE